MKVFGSQSGLLKLKTYLFHQIYCEAMCFDSRGLFTIPISIFFIYFFPFFYLLGKIRPGFRERMKTDSTLWDERSQKQARNWLDSSRRKTLSRFTSDSVKHRITNREFIWLRVNVACRKWRNLYHNKLKA